jgi:hypothetical protein
VTELLEKSKHLFYWSIPLNQRFQMDQLNLLNFSLTLNFIDIGRLFCCRCSTFEDKLTSFAVNKLNPLKCESLKFFLYFPLKISPFIFSEIRTSLWICPSQGIPLWVELLHLLFYHSLIWQFHTKLEYFRIHWVGVWWKMSLIFFY